MMRGIGRWRKGCLGIDYSEHVLEIEYVWVVCDVIYLSRYLVVDNPEISATLRR